MYEYLLRGGGGGGGGGVGMFGEIKVTSRMRERRKPIHIEENKSMFN